MAIDYDTAVGQVRLLVSDVDEGRFVFTDAQINAFLTMEGANVKRAAAQAIDTNATNEALASKVLKSLDLSTDGAKVADAMRKHAAALRDQALLDEEHDGAYFDVIDVIGDPTWPRSAGLDL